MRSLIRFYHFLGSIYFAIILIGLTAVFVAAGTFLEAHSSSHLFSAHWTYHNPLFRALIWGFFINILISALRRWPFRIKHIPFLTTHLGLLMLLAGVIIKSYYGIQGSMSVREGMATNRLFVPNTYFLQIEKNHRIDPDKKFQVAIEDIIQRKMQFDDLEIQLVDYSQNSSERKETWIKNGKTFHVSGLNPIPLSQWKADSIPSPYKVRFHQDGASLWNVIALATDSVGEIAKQLYIEGMTITLSQRSNGDILTKLPLKEALAHPILTEIGKIDFSIEWNFSTSNGLEEPSLYADIEGEKIGLALRGKDSLINKNISSPFRGKSATTIDLSREPIFLIIQDNQKDDHLFFFNPHGEIEYTFFKNDALQSLIVYDSGFGGYRVQTVFPFDYLPASRHEKEEAQLLRIAAELRKNLEKNPDLSPPLQLLKEASEKFQKDFAETTVLFLQAWDNSSQLLLSELPPNLSSILQSIDWKQVPEQEQYACVWLALLLDEFDQEMRQGKSFAKILQEKGWPLAKQFENMELEDTDQTITLFAQQLFSAASQLPKPSLMPKDIPIKALSAYLRTFGITLHAIRQSFESHPGIHPYHATRILETPLSLNQNKIPPLKKWEDNIPLVTLEIKKGKHKEYVTLTYDRYGKGLSWPVLNGEYKVHFQPLFIEIPYRVRLHDARQINYPSSNQAYSYESDIIVTDLRDKTRVEKTISMNNVHETQEGYRFYLASLSPAEEVTAQHVQIVVNYDPVKYRLTYPGALIMSLGIILLFWMKPYKKGFF